MNGLKEKYKNPDWDRIAHLFKIGIFASLLALIDIAVMRLVGNRPWAYALSTGWLSFGSLVTFIGLLVTMPKDRN